MRLADLVGVTKLTEASAAISEIFKKARSNFEERGLDTLFLSMGLASWAASDGGRPSSSPVLLVPVQAAQAGSRSASWTLCRAGDVKLNDVLVHALREEHGVILEPESLSPEILGDDEGEEFDLEPLFEAIRGRVSKVPGFEIHRRWVIGNFAFQKMAIVKDLTDLLTALAAHDIVAAIARDPGAEQSARGDRTSVDPAQFDRQLPEEEFLIRDADSSQQQAIVATLRGQNGVISGPPGTGKSQTISNLIAELVARGKTVLFVAEKRAALDVVLNRLKESDLAHLCLDCHGAELSRRHIAEQFQESLTKVREAPLFDAAPLHKQFLERRERLNAHVQALHAVRRPWGITLYQLYGRLLALHDAAVCEHRLNKAQLSSLDQTAIEAACEQVKELTTLSDLFTRDSTSPWCGASLSTVEQVRRSMERARHLASELWPQWEAALAALQVQAKMVMPQTGADANAALATIGSIDRTLEAVKEDIFRQDLPMLAEALQPASSLLRRLVATAFNGAYRLALRSIREISIGKPPSGAGALGLVTRARNQMDAWRKIALEGSGYPTRQPRFTAAASSWAAVLEEVDSLIKFFPGRSLEEMSLSEVGSWLRGLAADSTTPFQVLKLHGILKGLESQGFGPVLAEIAAKKPASEAWPDMLRHVWLSSCLAEIRLQNPGVPNFSGRRHDEIANEFRQLDRKRIEAAVQRVQRAHAIRALDVRNRNPEQNSLVTREAAKRSRHVPLRRLFAEAPDVVLALRPCWMASPLSVSQLIPGEKPLFDVVIFDEASQVLPEDAITSLLRGHQAVIAGDRRQLPPTTFFAAGEPGEDREEDEGTAGFQSILDVMSSFLDPAWSLDWHYRSRDETLIAYSNHRIYGGRLVTFPGPGATHAVRHVLVSHIPGAGAQQTSVSSEVQRVVDLVREHTVAYPHESLGVITMGIEHARRVEMALERARQEDPGLEPLFAAGQRERFFVKNLERVQGDERDAIILSTGYGKNDAGHLVYRFGPLLQEGGERRLNVAITRARQRMTVVSSFDHNDIQADYPKLGIRLLRGFLEYAASGGQQFEHGTVTDVPLNEFEQSVFDELTRRGLKLVGQVGTSRYRIDMVAMHPSQEGRFVLAIECDGASYHSAPTVRDRDRLRQQQLEALGWRFHRIWSTDWFVRREEEVQRALAAFRDAVRDSERPTTAASGLAEAQPQSPARVVEAQRTRGVRPRIEPGMTIADYSSSDLEEMVRWVCSDDKLRTDEEILSTVVQELGFQRRGTKIVAAIEKAIRSVRPGGS